MIYVLGVPLYFRVSP